jgi:hypothetical protein
MIVASPNGILVVLVRGAVPCFYPNVNIEDKRLFKII